MKKVTTKLLFKKTPYKIIVGYRPITNGSWFHNNRNFLSLFCWKDGKLCGINMKSIKQTFSYHKGKLQVGEEILSKAKIHKLNETIQDFIHIQYYHLAKILFQI